MAAPDETAGMLLGLVRVAVLRALAAAASLFALLFLSPALAVRGESAGAVVFLVWLAGLAALAALAGLAFRGAGALAPVSDLAPGLLLLADVLSAVLCGTAREAGGFFPGDVPVVLLPWTLPWRVAAPRPSLLAAGFFAAGFAVV